MNLENKTRIVLLAVCVLVIVQGYLFSEDEKFGVTLEEGSLILPDETRISIGDSFESLEFLSPRHLELNPGGNLYDLTDLSSISVLTDYDNEEITLLYIFLYSIDDTWTEIEKVDVEGMMEVSRGMKREQLVNTLEALGMRYVLEWSETSSSIEIRLRSNYKVSFEFREGISGGLERVQYWGTPELLPIS